MNAGSQISSSPIDDFLARLPLDQQGALKKLRKEVRAAAPKAIECISYGMPAFRLDGRVLVYFSASPNHCSFFPGSGTTVAAFKKDLRGFDTSKGTIRFQPDRPLPSPLVRKIVRARIEENGRRRSR